MKKGTYIILLIVGTVIGAASTSLIRLAREYKRNEHIDDSDISWNAGG